MTLSGNRSFGLENEEPLEQGPAGKYYLFVIAVDEYADSQLQNPVEDAASIVSILTSKYQFHVPTSGLDLRSADERYKNKNSPIIEYDDLQTKCLYNENATAENINTHLNAVRKEIGPDDSFLIYCAGHGEFDTTFKQYYFLPFGSLPNKSQTWYDASKFYSPYGEYEKDKKCKNLLVIIDCCFAGAISRGGAGLGTDAISRKVLASSFFDQPAKDGLKGHGSAFARALYSVLKENKELVMEINPKELKDKFINFFENQFDEKPLQKILYSLLPGSNGTSEFSFHKKHANGTPHEDLAQTFIKYLNFNDQKTDLVSFGAFTKDDNVKYIVVGIISKSIEIQKLQTKALFNQIKILKEDSDLRFSKPIITRPELVGKTIWEVLQVQLAVKETDSEIGKIKCAQQICNSLLTVERPSFREVQLFIYRCDFNNENLAADILKFCKELIYLIEESKKLQIYKGKFFKPLMIVIADTRDGDTQLLKHDDNTDTLDSDSRIVLTRPVTDLVPGFARFWHLHAKSEIKNDSVAGLKVDNYFGEKKTHDIEQFIKKVANDLAVDYTQLSKELWNYD